MNSNTTIETSLKWHQLAYPWEIPGEKLYSLMPPEDCYPYNIHDPIGEGDTKFVPDFG